MEVDATHDSRPLLAVQQVLLPLNLAAGTSDVVSLTLEFEALLARASVRRFLRNGHAEVIARGR